MCCSLHNAQFTGPPRLANPLLAAWHPSPEQQQCPVWPGRAEHLEGFYCGFLGSESSHPASSTCPWATSRHSPRTACGLPTALLSSRQLTVSHALALSKLKAQLPFQGLPAPLPRWPPLHPGLPGAGWQGWAAGEGGGAGGQRRGAAAADRSPADRARPGRSWGRDTL